MVRNDPTYSYVTLVCCKSRDLHCLLTCKYFRKKNPEILKKRRNQYPINVDRVILHDHSNQL